MFNPHCLICHDKKKFSMEVSEAHRISYGLECLKERYRDILNNIKVDTKDIYTLKSCCHMPHMMCGNCHKINDIELRRYHEQITQNIVEIKAIITSEKLDKQKRGALKGETHNYVRGHFPMMAQYIYRIQIK